MTAWLHNLAGARLTRLALASQINDLLVEAQSGLAAHALEYRSQAIKVVLRPILKRVVMTFGALDTGAQEELRGCLGRTNGIIARSVVIRRGMIVGAALSRQ